MCISLSKRRTCNILRTVKGIKFKLSGHVVGDVEKGPETCQGPSINVLVAFPANFNIDILFKIFYSSNSYV